MGIKNPIIRTIFDDLDEFHDFCRFNGHVFNEKDLYKMNTPSYSAFKKHQTWLKAKARKANRNRG